MRLRCLDTSHNGSYTLLESYGAPPSSNNTAISTIEKEEVKFYSEDGSYTEVVIEKNLVAFDLADLLAVKNRVSRDHNWSVVEVWKDLRLERTLEDHEDVLSVFRSTAGPGKQFVFRRVPDKYDFFTNPQLYFPKEMSKLRKYTSKEKEGNREILEKQLRESDENPSIFSQAYYRAWDDASSKWLWVNQFFLIDNTNIYRSGDAVQVKRFLSSWKLATFGEGAEGAPLELPQDHQPTPHDEECESGEWWGAAGRGAVLRTPEEEPIQGLILFADLRECEVYTVTNTREALGSPSEFGLCLRPSTSPDFSQALYLCPSSFDDQVCWLAAMRLAKYGKQIRENYKLYRSKQEEGAPGRDLTIENMKPRVAMDFTGETGRIVSDPNEASAIALYEGARWKRRFQRGAAPIRPLNANQPKEEKELHVGQPWFRQKLTREEAIALVNCLPYRDGVFVVRESKSKPGCFVLTSRHSGKIHILTIQPHLKPGDVQTRENVTFSLDGGTTRFHDLYQLIWYYILNPSASLPSRLLHWSHHSSSPDLLS